MSIPIIKVEQIGKQYRLGNVGTGTLAHDATRWWHTVRGKEDPYLKISEVNDRTQKGGSEYVWALQDINFEVQPGEILGIIGKNGAGKSTLLKLLSRVTAPTTGKITCHGRIASLLEVGTGFHPELTGKENIYLNGAILGMTKKEISANFDEIVDFAGCAKYIETPVKRYSSGMYVRLAFAVAAHLEPDILVVDEVLAVGDAEFQKKAIGKMKEVSQGQGRTVLFVSHNMASIQNLCKSVVLMENGSIKAKGETQEMIDLYLRANSTRFNTELATRTDRSGDQSVKLIDFWVETEAGKRIETIISGSNVTLVFQLNNNNANGKIDLGIGITNSNDFTLSIVYSSYQGKLYDIKETDDIITIKYAIEKFPFSAGTYKFVGRVLVNGVEADWPQYGISEMLVEKGDFYKTGDFGEMGLGPILIGGKWA